MIRFASNFTIALARGMLLKVIGWSLLARVDAETLLIGAMFFAFLLFASSTKDFADLLGDALNECETLPLRFGGTGAILLMSTSFVLPWLILPIAAYFGVLSGNAIALSGLGFGLACYGAFIARLLWLQRHDLDDSIRAIRRILALKAPHLETQEVPALDTSAADAGHASCSNPNSAKLSSSTESAARFILRASRRTRSEHDMSLAAAEVQKQLHEHEEIALNVGPVAAASSSSKSAARHRRVASTPLLTGSAASSASNLDGTNIHVAFDENHPAWRHMYFLMMFAQLGLVLSYLAPLF